jgi:hypothetical protein
MTAKLCVLAQDTSTIDSERFSEIRQVSAFFREMKLFFLKCQNSFKDFDFPLVKFFYNDFSHIFRKIFFIFQKTILDLSDGRQTLCACSGHQYHRFRAFQRDPTSFRVFFLEFVLWATHKSQGLNSSLAIIVKSISERVFDSQPPQTMSCRMPTN